MTTRRGGWKPRGDQHRPAGGIDRRRAFHERDAERRRQGYPFELAAGRSYEPAAEDCAPFRAVRPDPFGDAQVDRDQRALAAGGLEGGPERGRLGLGEQGPGFEAVNPLAEAEGGGTGGNKHSARKNNLRRKPV